MYRFGGITGGLGSADSPPISIPVGFLLSISMLLGLGRRNCLKKSNERVTKLYPPFTTRFSNLERVVISLNRVSP